MKRLNLYEICDLAEFLREKDDEKYVDAANETIRTLGYNGCFTLEDNGDISWSGVIAKKDGGEE